MVKNHDAARQARLRDGVFQPGKAEIAEEMKLRLELKECEEGDEARQRSGWRNDL